MNTPDQEAQTAAAEAQPESIPPARGHVRQRTQQPRSHRHRRKTATAAAVQNEAADTTGTPPWPRPAAGFALFFGSVMVLFSGMASLFFLLVFTTDETLERGVLLAICLLLFLFAAVFFIGLRLALAGYRHWQARKSAALPAAKKTTPAANLPRYTSAAAQNTAAAFRQPESTGFAAFAFWSIALLLCLVLTAAALLLTLMSLFDPERGSGFTLFLISFVFLFGIGLFFAAQKAIRSFRIYNAAQQQYWKLSK